MNIKDKLVGWEKILRDKCLKNELMDVKTINAPDFNKDLKDSDFFVFADFLKPGYH